MTTSRSGWLVDVLVGGAAGGLVAVVVALNLMIYLGPESGYETSLGELFAQSLPAGILVIVVLVAGPVLGVVSARGWRRSHQRSRESRSS